MSLTVKQLIAKLSKYPANSRVVVCAHDQDPDAGEVDGFVSYVMEAPEAIKERGASVVLCL